MRGYLAVSLILMSMVIALGTPPQAPSPSQAPAKVALAGQPLANRTAAIVQQTQPAVVVILVKGKCIGAAFRIGSKGLFIGCSHCVTSQAQLKTYKSKTLSIKIEHTFISQDLVLFSAPSPGPTIDIPANPTAFIGQDVLLFAHPFGYTFTVSKGIISGVNREVKAQDLLLTGLLQTDAAINPGCSGGPLIDLNGNLVGIACAYRTDGVGVGFAIPTQQVKDCLASISP